MNNLKFIILILGFLYLGTNLPASGYILNGNIEERIPEDKMDVISSTFGAITSFPWTEDFENGGSIPSGWTQEYVTSTVDYTYTSGGNSGNPSGAHGGSYNALLYYSSTSDHKTKLVSPELDLSGLTNAKLSFWHTQEEKTWFGGQDELRVYYKTSSGGTWTLIPGQTYTSSIAAWTHETEITLPNVSATYYIAFEGNAKKGYGVTIDDVRIDPCPAPSNQAESSVAATSASLSWTENGSATSWQIEYGASGYTQGTGTTITTSSNPYSLTGLSATTSYDWYVRSSCGSSNYSNWDGPSTFTTTCASVTSFPSTEGFESGSFPTCWSQSSSDDFDWTVQSGSTPSSNTGPSSAHSGSYYIYTETSSPVSNGQSAVIYTVNYDLNSVSNPRLVFYYHMYGSDMDPDGKIDIAITTNGGSSYTSIWSKTGEQGNQWFGDTVSLSSYSGTAKFRITGTVSTTGSAYQNDFAIDDFTIEETPSCPDPASQTESSVTTSSVSLYWSEKGSATTWQIEYGTSGFTKGSGTTITTTSRPYSLTGLSSASSYDWYVRASCGGSDYSNWVGPSTFSTACGGSVSAFPYSESFEGSTCWTQADVSGTSGAWAISTGTVHPSGTSAQDGSKLAYFNSYSASSGDQTRYVSPDFDFSSLNKPMLSYWLYHETGYSSSDDKIQPQVYSSSTWTNVGSSVSRYNGNTGWARYTVDLSAYSGTIKIGFLGTSAYGNDVHIDNIEVFDAKKTTNGKLSKCSPYYVRNGGSGSLYFYDDYTFSVDISGNYDIAADWTTGTSFDGYLYLYSPSFDPDNPATNLITSNDDYGSSSYSKISGVSLTASTNYVVVATTKNANAEGSSMQLSVEGSSIITAPAATDINAVPSSYTHNPHATDGTSRSANYQCLDQSGWTHYYYNNGTSATFSDDELMLSVKKNSNSIGDIGDAGFSVATNGASGVSHIINPPADYVSSWGGWYVFNRYWKLTPTSQPSTGVNVKYYYTTADFTALQNAINDEGGDVPTSHTQMAGFKINNVTGTYDSNPVNGHSGVPLASSYGADGCWIYSNGSSASTTDWSYTNLGSNYHSMEFVIGHFSGGGGGSSPKNDGGDGTPLPIELLSFSVSDYAAYNLISWTTASEINSSEFIIERSVNAGDEITIVGKTIASGSSQSVIDYQLRDNYPVEAAYYRLKSVDFDGRKQLSEWVYIQRNVKALTIINIHPNPAHLNTIIEFTSPKVSNGIIEIRDISGRVVHKENISVLKGVQTHKFDISGLEAGTYYIILVSENDRVMKVLIKE